MTVAPSLGSHLVPLTEGAATLLGAHRGRRWADDSELGFFEFLGTQFAGAQPHPMLAIYPQVTDAQNLIQQVLSAGKRGHSVAYLDLVRARVVRPITTSRCVREADKDLPLRAVAEGIPPEVINHQWSLLRAHLRVVEVASTVPYPAVLDQRAPSDKDLAQLATLLGIRAISWDLDLRDYGLAEQFDVKIAFAIGELAGGKCAAFVSLGLSAEATAAAIRLGRWSLGQAIRHPLLAVAIMVGLAVVVARLRKNRDITTRLTSMEWGPLLTQLLEAAAQLMTAYHELSFKMPKAPPVIAALPETWNVSRLLANAAGPISAREIVQQLRLHEMVVSEARVRDVLRDQPALFVRNRRGQWQLGNAPAPMVRLPELLGPQQGAARAEVSMNESRPCPT